MNDNTLLTDSQIQSITNYKRLGIDITVNPNGSIFIKQARLINGMLLNQKQLHERARRIFPDRKHVIYTQVYVIDHESISEDWIRKNMDKFGIKRKDIIAQLGLDKSYLSRLFSKEDSKNKIQLSKAMKSTFFYYFLSYELMEDIRELNKA